MTKTLRLLLFAFGCTAQLSSQTLPPPCPNGAEPSEDCATACVACDFNGYAGTTAGWVAGTEPAFCSMIQNDQWIGFIAGANSATFTVTPSNCTSGNGVQIALFGGCGESFVACNGGNAGNGDVPTVISAPLVPGTNYYLLIDGYSGDQCDFTISVSPPMAVIASPVGPVGAVSGPTIACPGVTAIYSVPSVSNAGSYTWTVPPGTLVNGESSGATFDAPGGNSVELTFGAAGGQVCVEASNACFQGGMSCKNVNVVPIPTTVLPKVTVCNEDAPYTLPWGQLVNVSGNYLNTYSSAQGCDSVVQLQVVIKSPIITNLAPKTVCAGDCVTVCGQNFCTTGQFSRVCTSYQGCDSLVNFQLTVISPVADILGGGTLSCATDSVILTSAPSAPASVKTWKKLDGTLLATNVNSLVVFEPGAVVLTTTQQQSGVICSKTDTIVIVANYTVPSATAATSDTLACQQPTVQLLGSSMTSGASFAWSGPNGFYSTAMSPTAYAAGTYTLTVTHPLSQCTAVATTVVLAEPDVPTVQAMGDTLTCAVISTTLQTTTSASQPTFLWTGPAGFTSNLSNPTVSVVGSYTVTVMDDVTGCLAIAVAQVVDGTDQPAVTATGGTISCADPSLMLMASTTADNPSFYWSGPGGFTSSEPNPTTTVPGTYAVTVTDGLTGCTASATASVAVDQVPPGAAASGGQLSCSGSPLSLQGSSPTAGVTFAWIGPGFPNPTPNPMVTLPGTYTLIVTASNGCTSTATAVVMAAQIPQITAVQVTNDLNGQGVGAISITIAGTTNYTVVWTSNGQLIGGQNLINLMAGLYVAVVTSIDGCTATVSAVVDNIVPTGEPDAADLWTIVPNPANIYLDIQFRGDALPGAHLRLFDLLGREVRSADMAHRSTIRMEVGDLPAGSYQLLIRDGEQTVVRPVVIQR